MAGIAKVFDGHILNKLNEEVDLNDEKYKGKIIGLYFSAHWCPPCRGFTPVLAEFYKQYSNEKNFEIIFISSDSDEESFNGYYEEMPWLKLDYKEQTKVEELNKTFHVNEIPTLILFDADSGDIICANARKHIQKKDKKGDKFPWGKNKKTKSRSSCILL